MKKLIAYTFLSILAFVSFSSSLTFAQTETPATIIPINLNTATDEEILSIPGTGNRMVREFKEYRPYKNIAQFRRELGKYVDEEQIAEWEKYVFVPTNPNTATEDELLALAGIDETMTQLIIANRFYADWAALSAVLSQSSDEATVSALEPYWIFE
jgi:DNA uptake protein ComE-like DNA-binding protein